ncbi:MAG: DUF1028 domain-containing protein [Bacteroidota bacterium]|nr:DUF1028 domain-containing protein [Bacteroidota bacterium]
MKKYILSIILIFPFIGKSQHTFSIVAIDSLTGEIGSAGATCGDSIIWPGTPGAKIISDLIPGKGAIHTQAYYNPSNQANAHAKMVAGFSPQAIIKWLEENDTDFDSSIRQYGIVDYNSGHPRSAAFTGSQCNNYKNHNLGANYSIQGNILLGQQILDSMENRFKNTKGTLADKLMAALQGANVVGADTRCKPNGTSSLSAFLRMAKPTDSANNIYIDLNIAGTKTGTEPIDELQKKYNTWKAIVGILEKEYYTPLEVSMVPNPSDGIIIVKLNNAKPTKVEIMGLLGQVVMTQYIISNTFELDLSTLNSGLYFINFYKGDIKIGTERIVKK